MASPKKKLTQALPAVMRRPNLSQYATREWKERITDLAAEACCSPPPKDENLERHASGEERIDISMDGPTGLDLIACEDELYTEPMDVILAPPKVQELAENYVSAKLYKVPLKEIRRITSRTGHSLRNKIHDLLESLPRDAEPPIPQMREKFCIQREATQHPADVEERWDEAYSATTVKHVLGHWITLMDEVNEDAGGKRSGADPSTAEIEFVLGLAHYWQDCLGNKVARWGEDPYSETTKSQDTGPFPRFVREAAKIIPPEYLPKSWNWAIRSAIDRLKMEVGSQSAES